MPEPSTLAKIDSDGRFGGADGSRFRVLKERAFSPEAFHEILERFLAAGYSFVRFDDESQEYGRTCFLRQDVDISPRLALAMGALIARSGITANYFIQLNAETYNVFNRQTLETINELRQLGHCVGLHVDETVLGNEEDKIARTLDWFCGCCAEVDPVVSFHRPSADVLGRQYESFLSAYAPRFFDRDRYASDSRRSLGFLEKVDKWLEQGVSPVQLVLHPEWWTTHSGAEKIWDHLSARREWELAEYLRANFQSVFEHVPTPKHDVFSL